MKLKKCSKCIPIAYTLKEKCQKCENKTIDAHYKFKKFYDKSSWLITEDN